jgi:esterase/lipase superfamily enzyme
MLIFGHSGYPVILFPTSRGKYYENKDFGLIDSVAGLVNEGKIKIYCPDSIDGDSWYNYSIHPADRVKTHMAFESMIINDVIPMAKNDTGRERVAVAGCSFGAYHAANLAFKYQDSIGYLISMGGAFDIKQFIMGYYDDNCYYNNPMDYLPGITDPWKYSHLGIVLGTGEWDMCLDENQRLSEILKGKGIGHWLDIKRWAGHDWQWWREMFPRYLSEING